MKDVGIYYGHLVLFTDFCHILWTFGTARDVAYFSHFGILYQEKSGNPGDNNKKGSFDVTDISRK
jgi:hypothetical protein